MSAAYVARVAKLVARYDLLGPLPTSFRVEPEHDGGRIVGARIFALMLRFDSRRRPTSEDDDMVIPTTSSEFLPLGLSDAVIEIRFHRFALSLYEHEFYEWFKRDGQLVADPHEDDPRPAALPGPAPTKATRP